MTIEEMAGISFAHANFAIEYSKDFDARRAAEASGFEPDHGYKLKAREDVQEAIKQIIRGRMERSHIDAQWVLEELVDNHYISRQQGNMNASNRALAEIAKQRLVDSLATSKMDVVLASDQELVERIRRGRQRAEQSKEEISFL